MNFREEAEQAARQQAAKKVAAERENQAERAAARIVAQDFVKYVEEEGFKSVDIYREVSFREAILFGRDSAKYELFDIGFLVGWEVGSIRYHVTVTTSGIVYDTGKFRDSSSKGKDYNRMIGLPKNGVIWGNFEKGEDLNLFRNGNMMREVAEEIASGGRRPMEPGLI